jgi:DNA-binding GntR family transcriptional regulator
MAIQRLHEQATAAAERGDAVEYARLNEDFHLAIYAAARNATMARVTGELRQRLNALRPKTFFGAGDRMKASAAEHGVVAAAIAEGNADRAWHGMRAHAASAAINVIESFRQGPGGAHATAAPKRARSRR